MAGDIVNPPESCPSRSNSQGRGIWRCGRGAKIRGEVWLRRLVPDARDILPELGSRDGESRGDSEGTKLQDASKSSSAG